MKCIIDEKDGEVRFFLRAENEEEAFQLMTILPKIKKPVQTFGSIELSPEKNIRPWAWVILPRNSKITTWDLSRINNDHK